MADTDPNRARYFRVAFGGKYRSGPWLDEIAQCSVSFVFGTGLGPLGAARAPLPSTLIEQIADTNPVNGDARFSSVWRVWQTENINGLMGDTWLHSDECDRIAQVTADFIDDIKKYQDPKFFWEYIKIYAMNSQHKSINGPNLYTLNGIAGTGGTANAHAPQTACSMTYFGNATQKGGTGRTYIPMTHVALTVDGTFGSSTIADVNTSGSLYVEQLWQIDTYRPVGSTPDGLRVHPAVIHKGDMTYTDVLGTGVGDLVDTQRRRRNARNEDYSYVFSPHAQP